MRERIIRVISSPSARRINDNLDLFWVRLFVVIFAPPELCCKDQCVNCCQNSGVRKTSNPIVLPDLSLQWGEKLSWE